MTAVLRSVGMAGEPDERSTDRSALDEAAALEVLLAHRDEFVDFVAARIEGRAAAEDLVQDALARALDRIGELRAGDAVLGWFYRLLRNAVIDHYRRRAASARALERLAAEPEPAAVDPPEAPARACRCVSHLAGTLKPEYAEALRRVEVDGVPVKEMAGELGISASNAAVRLFRARASLRKKVMATCQACAAAGCTDCTCDRAGQP